MRGALPFLLLATAMGTSAALAAEPGSAHPAATSPKPPTTRPAATAPAHPAAAHPAANHPAATHAPAAAAHPQPAARAKPTHPAPARIVKPAAPPPAPSPAPAAETPPAEPPKGASGLPLPRFAALRSDDVNFRTGPGTRYPIDWVYKRRDLPVEIEREFEIWRLVRDPDGTKGWVHQATLTGRRTAVVVGGERVLRQTASAAAPAAATLKAGVIVRLLACDAGSEWCSAQVGDYRGFIKRSEVWGLLPDEVIK